MTPDQFLKELQTLLPQPEYAHPPTSVDMLLQKSFEDFKSSLRKYLQEKRMRGLDARRQFLRTSRNFRRGGGVLQKRKEETLFPIAPRHIFQQDRLARLSFLDSKEKSGLAISETQRVAEIEKRYEIVSDSDLMTREHLLSV
ncbi:hypothetical protein BCR33DRAFT_732641 [Rhizoclosmatium globosum]|uniref:Uncharacterized protein n=1 Tax=Rhizoclosmatium globosum TaxID=329046 RepID=A0A1Y2D3J7_9FUNG|nr:hypothetical protein BCR33DRAFT_732641 [Rhizoclosmatium globosum]|eukprot:ORY53863.1 hypothetical protein BCR33DRAFT_732641 [Rhizoclosmatium globosum]